MSLSHVTRLVESVNSEMRYKYAGLITSALSHE